MIDIDISVSQVNRLEASETKLQLEVDDLTDKIEEIEEQIKSMKLTEKQLRATLVKTENNESELSSKLENAQGEVEVSRQYCLILLSPIFTLSKRLTFHVT